MNISGCARGGSGLQPVRPRSTGWDGGSAKDEVCADARVEADRGGGDGVGVQPVVARVASGGAATGGGREDGADTNRLGCWASTGSGLAPQPLRDTVRPDRAGAAGGRARSWLAKGPPWEDRPRGGRREPKDAEGSARVGSEGAISTIGSSATGPSGDGVGVHPVCSRVGGAAGLEARKGADETAGGPGGRWCS
jgi:hypothetical protein